MALVPDEGGGQLLETKGGVHMSHALLCVCGGVGGWVGGGWAWGGCSDAHMKRSDRDQPFCRDRKPEVFLVPKHTCVWDWYC